MNYLYILEVKPLSVISFVSILSWSAGCCLVLLWARNVFPMFSSRSFMVSCLIFKSLSHFEFILVCGVTMCSNFIEAVKLPTPLAEETFPLPPLAKISWSEVWVYFWALPSVPLIHLFLCQYHNCFDYCSLVVLSDVWEGNASYLVLFSQNCCSSEFYGSMKILGLFVLVKNVVDHLIGHDDMH